MKKNIFAVPHLFFLDRAHFLPVYARALRATVLASTRTLARAHTFRLFPSFFITCVHVHVLRFRLHVFFSSFSAFSSTETRQNKKERERERDGFLFFV